MEQVRNMLHENSLDTKATEGIPGIVLAPTQTYGKAVTTHGMFNPPLNRGSAMTFQNFIGACQ